jgi:hypothetical protein
MGLLKKLLQRQEKFGEKLEIDELLRPFDVGFYFFAEDDEDLCQYLCYYLIRGRQLIKIFLREQLSMRSKKDNYNFTIFFLCYYSIVSWIKRFLKSVFY